MIGVIWDQYMRQYGMNTYFSVYRCVFICPLEHSLLSARWLMISSSGGSHSMGLTADCQKYHAYTAATKIRKSTVNGIALFSIRFAFTRDCNHQNLAMRGKPWVDARTT